MWCGQSADHSKSNLVKFGYIPDMKVNKEDPSIFLATGWNLSKKSGNSENVRHIWAFCLWTFVWIGPDDIFFPGRNLTKTSSVNF